MPFPDEPLPISVDIAPGASPAGTVDSWDPYWVDITRDVRVAQGITIDEGIPDEANQADPGSCVMTLNNSASKVAATLGQRGVYTPRNPRGPYWGKLAKNTPLRVRLQRGRDTFNRVESNTWGVSESGIVWSLAGSAHLSTDGTRGVMTANGVTTATNAGTWDFEMTAGFAVDALPGGAGNYTIAFFNYRRSSNTNQYRLRIDYDQAGDLRVYTSRVLDGVDGGVLGNFIVGGGAPAVANRRYNVRLKVEGGSIRVKVWDSTGAEPTNWQISRDGEGAYTMDNTALGTNIQFQRSSIGTPATTKMYFYDVTINSFPFIGTVPEWPPRWDQSGNDATVPLKATGVLRRLQSGKAPLRSPFQSYIEGRKPAALWMLEDESGADLAASSTTGVKGATFYDSSPGGWDGTPLGGTKSQFSVNPTTTIAGTLPAIKPNGSWLAWFTFYMPVLPVTNPIIFRVRASGTISTWDIRVSDDFGGVMYVLGVAADGSGNPINQSIPYTPGQWAVGQLEIQQTGSTFTARIVCYHVGAGVTTGATHAAISGNIGAPQGWSIYGETGFQEGGAGPVAFFPFIPSVNIGDLLNGARGFVGETAEARIARLCAERGVRLDLLSGGRTTPMGVQSSDTFLNLIGEAAETDLGLLTEFRGGLRYRTRGRRYGQTSRMTLDFAQGHIKEPPEPMDDDQRLVNDVTVTRKNGGSARAVDLDSIAVNDVYDTSIEINPSTDDVLPGHASWRLYLGTYDAEMRWPSVTVDLARNGQVAGFLERATSVDPGTYVTLTNPPLETPVGSIRLLVEHVRQRLGPYEWTMELTCSPYRPWIVPFVAAASTSAFNRIDLVGSTLASAEAEVPIGTQETWDISNAGRRWTTTAGDFPIYWRVAGEVVQVNSITGTGAAQVATVTRGTIEGFTKAHVPGEEIHMAYPLYVGL